MNILVCDDDRAIVDAIEIYLSQEGYTVLKAYDGMEAIEMLKKHEIHLLLIDIMMPRLDGFTVCKIAREMGGMPIILLTARSGEEDKLRGYGCGADDYMTKPFSPRVLLAKVNALLRRSSPAAAGAITAGKIMLHPNAHTVCLDGQEIALTHKEYELLSFLMANPGQIFSREQLLNRVWGFDFAGSTRTVDTHIKTLRQKLGDEGRHIVTLIRSGYKFEAAV